MPTCGKVFERIVFHQSLEFIDKKKILFPYQPGFLTNNCYWYAGDPHAKTC